jgi:hypothetical protein
MVRVALFIISLFLIVSCDQDPVPSAATTINSALGADSSKTTQQNKKPTSLSIDTALVYKGDNKLQPAFIGTVTLFSPLIKDLDDDDDEDDDDEDDEKEGKLYYLYKHP